jgi:tricorn protease
MKSDSRAILAFTLVGVVLIVLAWFVSHAFVPEGGAATLPATPYPHVAAPVGSSPPIKSSAGSAPRLMQQPSLSKTQIAFSFAGEIWTVSREGGEAQRVVTGQLRNFRPLFSPDGSQIAFTGVYDGNWDVYVVPAAGGETHRLTFHPGYDAAVGWTPEGNRVLFQSLRDTPRDLPKLFTVPLAGGAPEELPLPSGTDAAYSPDGKRLAYIPYPQWQPDWKKYRGGQTTPIYVANLATSQISKVPRDGTNDRFPMWSGETVYFLSDRNGPFTLFGYDTKSLAVRELVHNADGFDFRYASAGPGAIVYEQLGQIGLYDLASGATHTVPIGVSADLPQVRARFERVSAEQVLNTAISPNGKRVLFEAHGEILSVPAEKGDVRNLTQSPGVADRDPAWSPDGKWIAWLSDESGEYALYFREPDGVGPVKKVDLGQPGSFFYAPRWSPDSKKITLTDKRLNLWLIDIEQKALVKVDTDRFEGGSWFDPAWAPDSRFIAYAKLLSNHRHAIYIYSLEDKSIHQVTDGRSESVTPRFDRSGKYLWLLASTDIGLAGGDGMSNMGRPVTSSVYAVVLAKDQLSPVAPESDDEGIDAGAPGDKGDKDKADKEKDKGEKDKGDKGKGDKGEKGEPKPAKPVKIDFDAIDQRIVALPIDRANYQDLQPGAAGVLFLVSAPIAFADEDYLEFDDDNPAPVAVTRFDLKKRKTERFLDKIDGPGPLATFLTSFEGNKVFYQKDKKWFIVSADDAPKEGDGALKPNGLEVWVDPRAEWRQMYHEVWRVERDFLYDANAHGLDLAAAEKLYARFVDGIAGRDDLNVLFGEMLSNLVLGHVRTPGGAVPRQERVNVGLLGADYVVEDGHYRIAKILAGENWNPKLKAPLTGPGVDVKEGEYLLAVNGQELRGDDDVSRLFLGRAGRQTILTVGPKPTLTGSRHVTVVPVGSEGALRLRGWMEASKKKVDELSGGRVGYVFIPDTHAFGYANFNRYYFSQVGKDAVVLDERFNHGGLIADYIIDVLKQQPIMGAATREGEDTILPLMAIFGPKVMIANQVSGSGGDALPWLFKKAGLGPLVGVRTWGGLVGVGGYPRLIDGGHVTAPRWALYGTTGQWEVENHGIAPDVEVEQDPALVREGHDPQLEKAVQLALDALAKTPPVKLARPAYPNYGPRLPKVNAAPRP